MKYTYLNFIFETICVRRNLKPWSILKLNDEPILIFSIHIDQQSNKRDEERKKNGNSPVGIGH